MNLGIFVVLGWEYVMIGILRYFVINVEDVDCVCNFYSEVFGWIFIFWGFLGFY